MSAPPPLIVTKGAKSTNPTSHIGSLWDDLNRHLIAKIYEVDHTGLVIGDRVLHAALADETQLDVTFNWQSPFEQAGPESKAPTVMAMLQSGAIQPLADNVAKTARQFGADGIADGAQNLGISADEARGRTGMTKLNSTQVFSGMPPLKIQTTLLLRAWRDPSREVEQPLDQLMQWALPRELAPEGTLLTGALEWLRGEKTFLDAALPSLAPTLIGITYKGRTYAPMVIEAVSVPLHSPIDVHGRFVQLAVGVTLSSLTAWDRKDWLSAQYKGT
jgi:hypothetical protein